MLFHILYELMGAIWTRVHFDGKSNIHFTSPRVTHQKKLKYKGHLMGGERGTSQREEGQEEYISWGLTLNQGCVG